jgi:hypothetical protein
MNRKPKSRRVQRRAPRACSALRAHWRYAKRHRADYKRTGSYNFLLCARRDEAMARQIQRQNARLDRPEGAKETP